MSSPLSSSQLTPMASSSSCASAASSSTCNAGAPRPPRPQALQMYMLHFHWVPSKHLHSVPGIDSRSATQHGGGHTHRARHGPHRPAPDASAQPAAPGQARSSLQPPAVVVAAAARSGAGGHAPRHEVEAEQEKAQGAEGQEEEQEVQGQSGEACPLCEAGRSHAPRERPVRPQPPHPTAEAAASSQTPAYTASQRTAQSQPPDVRATLLQQQ
jgi:hypothetical protein